MSLNAMLNIGKSALAVNQSALQTVGNNISNAGNADYTRQRVDLTASPPTEIRQGLFVGNGVELDGIRRQIDEALESRLRSASAGAEGAKTFQEWYSRVESVFNELTDQDLSTGMSKFFNAWSNLAQKPQDMGQRQVVVEAGKTLANQVRTVRGMLGSLASDAGGKVVTSTTEADRLITQIAELNGRIVTGGGASNNALMDSRDALVRRLGEFVEVSTRTYDDGTMNVFSGSEPLVLGARARGITTEQQVEGDLVTYRVIFKDDKAPVPLSGGSLAAMNSVQEAVGEVVGNIDSLAGGLIFELNKLHSSAQGLSGLSSVTSQNVVVDEFEPLISEEAGLDFVPKHGSFVVSVKDRISGAVTSTLINVDADGLNSDDTTLAGLATAIDAVDNLSARVVGGRLEITSDSSSAEFSFSQDSSGVLASLGIGTFFTGSDGTDIDISETVQGDPKRVAAAQNGQPGDNQSARAIASLRDTAMEVLGGRTLIEQYESTVNTVASRAAFSRNEAEATRAIADSLVAQRESVSGVSLDEEAIKLLQYQRAYQGAARVVSVTDELMQTIMGLVR